mgnify:CR=1 FL=1
MHVVYTRCFTGAPATCIAVVSAMPDLTLINGECEDRHGPKGLSIAEHVWMFHTGRSVYVVLLLLIEQLSF